MFIPGIMTQDTIQAITGQRPFPGAGDGMIVYNVITGGRPARPPGPNEWLSDDVWNFISRCWSPSLDGRPDVNFAINALNDAADAVEVRRGKSYATTNDQGKRTSRRVSGTSHRHKPRRGIDCVVNRRSPAQPRHIDPIKSPASPTNPEDP